jgi:ABC-type Fe3+-hydroxamate transport system substrate-binding protein
VIDRRSLIAGLSAALIAPPGASARTGTDAAGRSVPVPAKVSRVTRERLEALYGAPVHMIADAIGTAFIPG